MLCKLTLARLAAPCSGRHTSPPTSPLTRTQFPAPHCWTPPLRLQVLQALWDEVQRRHAPPVLSGQALLDSLAATLHLSTVGAWVVVVVWWGV